MFNDVAVAIRVLQREGRIARAAVVDLDVHHGNGTAAIFAGEPRCSRFSMHQWNNYPAEKPASSLDVHLPDGTGDAEYLRRAASTRCRAWSTPRPTSRSTSPARTRTVDDQLGGLSLTQAGLRLRDRLVLADACAPRGSPWP